MFDPIPLREPEIIFVSLEDGDFDIYGVSFDGSGYLNLTNNDFSDSDPVISPNGDEIFYLSDNKLASMKINGTNKKNLAVSRAVYSPVLSNSGEFIIFGDFSFKEGHEIDDIFKYDLATKEIINLTNGNLTSGNLENWYPCISPDDKKIVYRVTLMSNATDTTFAEFNSELFIMDSNGQNHFRLTSSDKYFTPIHPKFAKNSELVVFRRARELYMINSDGSNMAKIFPNREYRCRKFKIHPDGERIIFAGSHHEDASHYTGIFSYQIATGEVREIITAMAPPYFVEFDISKNGDMIVYRYRQNLYRIDFDGSNSHRISNIYELATDIYIRPF